MLVTDRTDVAAATPPDDLCKEARRRPRRRRLTVAGAAGAGLGLGAVLWSTVPDPLSPALILANATSRPVPVESYAATESRHVMS